MAQYQYAIYTCASILTLPQRSLPTEDCTDTPGMPCSEYAMCEELPKRDNFTCTCIPPSVGDGFMCTHGRWHFLPSL